MSLKDDRVLSMNNYTFLENIMKWFTIAFSTFWNSEISFS